eukprot:COSAG01_NODE_160_length_23692_cov_9.703599_4_plen_55_part_00
MVRAHRSEGSLHTTHQLIISCTPSRSMILPMDCIVSFGSAALPAPGHKWRAHQG